MRGPTLVVHGGAGVGYEELRAPQRSGCAAALAAGWRVLQTGGSALDAVCAAVVVLEDDPAFNAGVGSCLTNAGTVEMDASVMDGRGLQAGAVAVVRRVRHPIELARAVMQDGRHVFMAGPEADAFAATHGVATCAPEELIAPPRGAGRGQHAEQRGETVGAVAVDRAGHVAAATSTGGIAGKQPGRVGDSAIIGAGVYADDMLGAASATGNGEAIMRVVLAKSALDAMRDGSDPRTGAERGIALLHERAGAVGGIIVVDPFGRFAHAYNTPHMTVAWMSADLPEPIVHG